MLYFLCAFGKFSPGILKHILILYLMNVPAVRILNYINFCLNSNSNSTDTCFNFTHADRKKLTIRKIIGMLNRPQAFYG